MTLAIMQPYFFPYIGYYQLLNAVDKFVVYDDVNYIKRGWINRNNILVNHAPSLFTIPVAAASQNKCINEIELTEDVQWKKKFLKTIELSYKKAPHFTEIYKLLEDILNKKTVRITDLIYESLLSVAAYLDLKTQIVRSSALYNNKQLKGQERILDICRLEKATGYINSIGGKELYNKETFSEAGINLNFLESRAAEYEQLNGSFVPYLSFIDVLMFNSKENINTLLNQYVLV